MTNLTKEYDTDDDGTIESNVDNVSTDTEEFGFAYPSGSNDNTEALSDTEDSTTSGIFDMDLTGLTAYDLYIVHFQLQDHSGAANKLGIRFNEDSTANYDWYDTTGFHSGDTEGTVCEIRTNGRLIGYCVIDAGGAASSPSSDSPTYYARASRPASERGTAGRLTKNVTTVDDVRLFTAGNATGNAVLRGYDFP